MNRQFFTVDNNVVITEADYDRLKRLTESPRDRCTQAQRLATLRAELERGRVVSPASVGKGVVTMNSKVMVRDEEDDAVETHTLVYPEQANYAEGKTSVLAPIGTALLGAHVGQVVEFKVPGGSRRVRIMRVLYQPEAAGHFHL